MVGGVVALALLGITVSAIIGDDAPDQATEQTTTTATGIVAGDLPPPSAGLVQVDAVCAARRSSPGALSPSKIRRAGSKVTPQRDPCAHRGTG